MVYLFVNHSLYRMESVEHLRESFKAVVDLTESNFQTYLPLVLETIENCDFIAFDLEFSGTDYKSYFRSVYVDTVFFPFIHST